MGHLPASVITTATAISVATMQLRPNSHMPITTAAGRPQSVFVSSRYLSSLILCLFYLFLIQQCHQTIHTYPLIGYWTPCHALAILYAIQCQHPLFTPITTHVVDELAPCF